MPRDLDIVTDILNSCNAIHSFISGFSEQDFFSDQKAQSAVIYQLMIIGEAAKRLSSDFRAKNKTIPWQDWGDFRNILIHQYDGIELEQVWFTISREIPELKEFLQRLAQ